MNGAVVFRIAAQDLGSALNAFALQSGREILFDEAQVAGEATEGIHGSHEPIAALEHLLADANVGYSVNELDTILVGNASTTWERETMQIDNGNRRRVQRPWGFRRLANALATVIAAGGTAIVGAAAGAEEGSTDAEEQIEEVVVIGIRGSMQQSLERKRQADHFVDAITAEDIGAFPEQNLAEALATGQRGRHRPQEWRGQVRQRPRTRSPVRANDNRRACFGVQQRTGEPRRQGSDEPEIPRRRF